MDRVRVSSSARFQKAHPRKGTWCDVWGRGEHQDDPWLERSWGRGSTCHQGQDWGERWIIETVAASAVLGGFRRSASLPPAHPVSLRPQSSAQRRCLLLFEAVNMGPR